MDAFVRRMSSWKDNYDDQVENYLDSRHRWIISRLKTAFGPEVELRNLENFFLSPEMFQRVNQFLDSGSSRVLLFTVKKPDPMFIFGQESDELERQNELILIEDDRNQKLEVKGVYFFRMLYNFEGEHTTEIRDPDNEIGYGEMSPNVLESYNDYLQQVMLPRQSDESLHTWGQADSEHMKNFSTDVRRFANIVHDAVRSLQGGIELRRPEERFIIENKQQSYLRAASDPDILSVYEGIMESWCEQCENFMAESESVYDSANDNSGPESEFDFWRSRMTKFNSIAEQLKSRECKCVLGVVGQSRHNKTWKKWKVIDKMITDALNEARDNVKYLSTLEKVSQPLYSGEPVEIIEALPAIFNSVKVIFTIARYYGTRDRISILLSKISNQLILNCREHIRRPPNSFGNVRLWDQESTNLIARLALTIKLQEEYVNAYQSMKEKLMSQPKGKQFELNESQIFGKLDSFVKRVQKVLDMFVTFNQFKSLASHNIEGMEFLVKTFFDIMSEFKRKPYDLLDYSKTAFDRDYLEYTSQINELEEQVQTFINASFENINSTEQALSLLKEFEDILVRDSFKSVLDSKYTVIFYNYILDLERIQKIYEKQKVSPPTVWNLPPVSANIIWAKQLLAKIEEPMKKFRDHEILMRESKEAKRIIKQYNKVARVLVEYETLWQDAWIRSIEAAKSGLQATLIIRHPITGRYFVNFDREIIQLIRETKVLQRCGIDIPDTAKTVMVQEEKFKSYYHQLSFVLYEYERVTKMVVPIVRPLLKVHIADLESTLQPGMVLLTWHSMNIESFLERIHVSLNRFEDLVRGINDIVENRIERNLKIISRSLLVDLPTNESFTLEQFIMLQEKTIKLRTIMIQSKNNEIEQSLRDLINIVLAFPLQTDERIEENVVDSLWNHYANLVYVSVLRCTKQSFFALKRRLASKSHGGFLYMERPFFDVDIELANSTVTMNPSLDEIQNAVNRCALNILRTSKLIFQWSASIEMNDIHRESFHPLIAKDYQIVSVCLILTGAIEGIKKQVHDYLQTFMRYDFFWKTDKHVVYGEFENSIPGTEEFEREIQKYQEIGKKVNEIPPVHNIGCLSLETGPLKKSLKYEISQWEEMYSMNLHKRALNELNKIQEEFRMIDEGVDMEIKNLESVQQIFQILKMARNMEGNVESRIFPIQLKYTTLLNYSVKLDEQEVQRQQNLIFQWQAIKKKIQAVSDNLFERQLVFQNRLIEDIKFFAEEIRIFRADFVEHGPMESGISTHEASNRVEKYKQICGEKEKKWKKIADGEHLFGLPVTRYADLIVTKKELELLENLYILHDNVIQSLKSYKRMKWKELIDRLPEIIQEIDILQNKCKQIPRKLANWEAYRETQKSLQEIQEFIPVVEALNNHALRERHIVVINGLSGLDIKSSLSALTLDGIMQSELVKNKKLLDEIGERAIHELSIERKLIEIEIEWSDLKLEFSSFKSRGPVLIKIETSNMILQKVGESTTQLDQIQTSKYQDFFAESIVGWIDKLNNVELVLEKLIQIQGIWHRLETIFSSLDAKKHLPQEAKRFDKIDKAYMKLTSNAFETPYILKFCTMATNLYSSLESLGRDLEICQASISNFLDIKRLDFPRFCFVPEDCLVDILCMSISQTVAMSQLSILFNSLRFVVLSESSPHIATGMTSSAFESVTFTQPIDISNDVTKFLAQVESGMQTSLNSLILQSLSAVEDLDQLLENFPSQLCLLAMNLNVTQKVEEYIVRIFAPESISQGNVRKFLDRNQEQLVSKVKSGKLNPVQRDKVQLLLMSIILQTEMIQTQIFGHVESTSDYDWMKQAKITYSKSTDEAVIEMLHFKMSYSNELISCKDRIIVTPPTERCFLLMALSIAAFNGSLVCGLSGSGKSEVVAEFARLIGVFAVFYHCPRWLDENRLETIFKGVATMGCWFCYENFHSMTVLASMISSKMICNILDTLKQRRNTLTLMDGQTCRLMKNTAIFLTHTMPCELQTCSFEKSLSRRFFRTVSVQAPDFRAIIRIKLQSVGLLHPEQLADDLAKITEIGRDVIGMKIRTDYIHSQTFFQIIDHFFLQNRFSKDYSESVLLNLVIDLYTTQMDHGETVAFTKLLELNLTGKVGNHQSSDWNSEFSQIVQNQGLEFESTSAQTWYAKLKLLSEFLDIHFSVGVFGQALTGKSSLFECMKLAFQTKCKKPIQIRKLYSRSNSNDDLFGFTDLDKKSWQPGLFEKILKTSQEDKNTIFWIILDGPLNYEWNEHLHRLLDAHGIFTSFYNIVELQQNCKLMFENDDMSNMSPSTVSRIGIVYLDPSSLGWQSIFKSLFLQSFTAGTDGIMMHRLQECLSSCFQVAKAPNYMNSHYVKVLFQHMKSLLVSLDEKISVLERKLGFAILWTYGMCIEADLLSRIERCILDAFPEATPPGNGSMTNYFLDEDNNWKTFHTGIMEIVGKDQAIQVYFPSQRQVQISHMLEMNLKNGLPSFLIGDRGSSKTFLLNILHARSKALNLTYKNICISSESRSTDLTEILQSQLKRKICNTYQPKSGGKFVLCIEDLNLSTSELGKGQPMLELLRQMFTEDGMYNVKDGKFNRLTDISYVGSFNVRDGERGSIPARLRGRMHAMFVSYNQKEAEHCFSSLLKHHMSHLKNVKQLTDFVIKMFSQTIQVYEKLKNSHVLHGSEIYSLHTLSKICSGILKVDLQNSTKESFLRLLKHECEREFLDVLFDDASYQTGRNILQQTLYKSVDAKMSQKIQNSRCLYSDGGFLHNKSESTNTTYTKFTPEEFFHCAKEHLDTFVSRRKEYEGYVLFEACIENLAKVLRFLTHSDRSICFLVGNKATGREFVCRLACYMMEFHLEKIDSVLKRPSSSIQERTLHDSAMRSDASASKQRCFIVRNAVNIGDLEWHNLNQLVSESDILHLNRVENGVTLHTIHELQDHESIALRGKQTKMIFFMDASILRIKQLVQMFPQMLAMQFMRFENISAEVHFEIGSNSLSNCFANLGSVHKYARVMLNVHSHAIQISNEFQAISGCHFHFDIRNFKTFLSKFAALYREKVQMLEIKFRRVRNAIARIELYQRNLEETENRSRQDEASLKNLRSKISETFKEVTSDKSALERQKRKMELIQEDIAQNDAKKTKVATEIKSMRASADQRFYDAINLLNQVKTEQIDTLNDLEHRRSPHLQYLCDLLATLSHLKLKTQGIDLMWMRESIESLKRMNPDGFNEEDHEFLLALLEKEAEMLESCPDNFVKELLLISLKFMHGLADYTLEKLRTKALLLKEKEFKSLLLVLGKTYNNTFEEIARMETNILSKEANFTQMNQEKNDLEEKNAILNSKLLKSRDFHNSVENDYRVWKSYLDENQENETSLIKHTLIQSLLLVYCGGFDGPHRTKMLQHLFSLLNEEYDVALVQRSVESMVTKQKINEWKMSGLLLQDFFVQNAVLIENSIGIPFIIDPDGEGLRWLMSSLDSPVVNMSKSLTEGVCRTAKGGEGKERAVINVLWQDDPSPAMLGLFYDLRQEGTELPASSLYLVSSSWNSAMPLPPNSISPINFTLSQDLYEHVTFDVLLIHLRHELCAQQKQALKSVLDLELQIDTNFETLMSMFSQEEPTLMEDSHLTSLVTKRNHSAKVLESAQQDLTNISMMMKNSSENLRLNSQRCAMFLAALFQMNKINPGYCFCLQMVLKLIVRNDSVVKSPEEFTYNLYALLCNSLLIRDRALFGVLLSLQILISEGTIPPETTIQVPVKPPTRKSSTGLRLPWVNVIHWNQLVEFVKANPYFESVLEHIMEHSEEWQSWYNLDEPEKHFPSDLNFRYKKAAIFVRFITLKILRPDRIVQACSRIVEETLGNHNTKTQDDDLHFISTLVEKHTPILLIGAQSFDPVQEITNSAHDHQIECMLASVVHGEPVASRILSSGISVGSWMVLENVELDLDLAESIVLTVYDRKQHLKNDFRLWLTMNEQIDRRKGFLNEMICLLHERPSSFRMNLGRTFQSPDAAHVTSYEDTPQFPYKSIFLAITMLHASLVTRQLCAGLTWSFTYSTEDSDFHIIAEVTKSLFGSSLHENRSNMILKNLKHSIQDVLAGRIMESADTSTLSVYINHFVSSAFLQELVSDLGSNFQLNDMDFMSLREFFNSISQDQELRFMSLNSMIPAQRLQLFSHEELDYKLSLALKKREHDHRLSSCLDVLEKINLLSAGSDAEKLHEVERRQSDGASDLLALNFNYEYARFCKLVSWLREQVACLCLLQDSDGTSESAHWKQDSISISRRKVPQSWQEMSWPEESLSDWLERLSLGLKQAKSCASGAPPFSLWLPGFLHPEGILDAMGYGTNKRDEAQHSRSHLDLSVTDLEVEDLNEPSQAGHFIHGLKVRGGEWSKRRGKFSLGRQKLQPCQNLPVIQVSPHSLQADRAEPFYMCPCYKNSQRHGNFLCFIRITTDESVEACIASSVAVISTHKMLSLT